MIVMVTNVVERGRVSIYVSLCCFLACCVFVYGLFVRAFSVNYVLRYPAISLINDVYSIDNVFQVFKTCQ